MAERLTDANRARLCVDFALKARAARAALNEYADTVAGSDTELRDQLRLIVGLWLLSRASRSSRVEQAVDAALIEIEAQHRAARCAMNDAAGQSWRNLAE